MDGGMPRFRHVLGCRKDPEDARDIPITRLAPELRAKLPARLDYTKKMSAVSDQGDEGTCVGFASVDGMKEYQEKAEWAKDVQLSVRYLYSECKKLDGYPDEEGTDIRCAMKVLRSHGVPPEKCWPYKPHQQDAPCGEADDLAKIYRIERYARLRTVDEMKESLHANGPFVAGVEVYYEAWNAAERSGKVRMPGENDILEGGHAICIVGYDDKNRLFKFKNSWSDKWGAKGYGYLPYDYMKKHLMDAWSARDRLHG